MKKVTIENTLGRSQSIDLPEDPSEVPITKYIDYSMSLEKFFRWYNQMAEDGTLVQNRSLYIYQLCKILSEYFDVDLNELVHYDASKLLDESGHLKVELMADHAHRMNEGISDMDQVEDTLLTLALSLNSVVSGYEPTLKPGGNYLFEYKGEEWVIPRANILDYNFLQYPKFTVHEIVESMEIQRFAAMERDKERKAANREDRPVNTDVIGSATLTEYLTVFAILCRKKGEQIDLDNFDDIIASRVRHFIDLDMKTVRDLLFFSNLTLNDYVKSLAQDISSTLQNAFPETQLNPKP